jgi:hypothetical protein
MYNAQLVENEKDISEEDQPQEYLLIGIDISEEEAIFRRWPIHIGLSGEPIVWCDNIDPR